MYKKLLIVILIGTIVLALVFYKAGINEKANLNESPLPEKYSGFQEIDENYKSEDFEVKLLCESFLKTPSSTNPIRIFPSLNGNLIVECDVAKDENSREDTDFYKIDKDGNVIDVFHFKYERHYPHFINEFIVFTDEKSAFFSTWPSDGNKAKTEIEVLNNDLNWDKNIVISKIEDIKKNSKYYFVEFDNSKNISQYTYYKDNKWQLLLQKMPGYSQYSDEEKVYRYRKDIFQTGEPGYHLEGRTKFLYFYPEEKMKYFHYPGGGNASSKAENWRGKAFFKTLIGEKQFHFFVPKLVMEEEEHNNYKKNFYKLTKENYSVDNFKSAFYISEAGFAFYTDQAKKLYLITQKK